METIWPHPQKATHNTSKYGHEINFLKINERGFQGRLITTLPLTLVHDLDILYKATLSIRDHSYYKRLKLNNEGGLEVLRNLTRDRVRWRELTKRIVEGGDEIF